MNKLKSLELWENEDHYIIQLLNADSVMQQPLPDYITCADVMVFCFYFSIRYSEKWSVYYFNGQRKYQITIPKETSL